MLTRIVFPNKLILLKKLEKFFHFSFNHVLLVEYKTFPNASKIRTFLEKTSLKKREEEKIILAVII